MLNVFCATLCLLLLTTNGSSQDPGTTSFCDPGSSCVPLWKCSNESTTVNIESLYRSAASETNGCRFLQTCCKNESIIDPIELPAHNFACGRRNTDNPTYIDNRSGKQSSTQFAEFPWVVAIFVNNPTSQEFIGGGSVLSPNVVLTAAHIVCSRPTEDLRVRVGEWNKQAVDSREQFLHAELEVLVKICHENYNNLTMFNDIAVLNLRTPFEFAHHIMPICLPRKYEYPNVERCFVAGWGKDQFTATGTRNILRKVDLPIMNNTRCQRKFRRTRLGRHFELDDSFLCAGGEKNVDACTGDGGSPLFCPLVDHPGQYYQIGIVSWGLSCNYEDVPSVYVNVTKQLHWLHLVLVGLAQNPDFYVPSFKREYLERETSFKMLSTNSN